jgi:hypothetical protein
LCISETATQVNNMKKITTTFLLVITLVITSYGQAKDTTAPKLTDTTKLFSVSDLVRLSEPYKDQHSYREYQSFVTVLNKIIADAIKEWESKNKKSK